MKVIVALAALVAVTYAAPQGDDARAVVLRSESDNIGVDGYKFAFDTSNGISRQEVGELSNAGTDNESLAVRGSISWTDKEGKSYKIDFTADENGFRPVGAHIPQV